MAPPLRIFISSPGDVDEERRRAALVVSRLKREFVRFFELSAILWEYEPMLSSGHFQDIIDPPSTADILVLILWSRLGTPLPERTATREYKRRDGHVPVTGTEWEYEEALAAREKAGIPDLLVYRKFSDGFARFSRAEQLDEIRRQWESLQVFWQRHFETPDGRFKAAFNRFQSLDEFEAQLEAHLRELLRRRLPAQGARVAHGTGQAKIDWWSGSPYAGLKAFDVEQAAVFFGRERAEREITENLVRHAAEGAGLMLVLGASGSGKSSVVRAGVLPDLMASGVVAEVSTWRYAIMQPAELASDPFAGLAAALMRPQALPELGAMGYQVTDIAAQLAGDPTLAVMPVRLALERAAESDKSSRAGLRRGRLVLVLDQLEVLFTSHAIDETILKKLDALLAKLAQSGLVWIVGTVRSDFYHQLVALPQLNALAIGLGQYLLAPPGAPEIEQIIRGPADVAGLSFEVDEKTGIGLDATIREAAARDPASLPLLSFVLDELYRRDVTTAGGNVLTFKSYRDLGGLEGAIAHHADDLLEGLTQELASALPALLLSLVDIDEVKSLVTARAVHYASFSNPLHVELANRLVAARLAVADDTGMGRTLRFAHEALLTNWPTLTKLIEQHRDFLVVRRRLYLDAVAWQRHDRHADYLLPPGRRLAEAEEALAQHGDQLDQEIRTFAVGLRRELARSRRIAAVVSLLLLAAVTAGYFAWQQKREAERSYLLALDQAAGSIEMLAEGYDQGAVVSKLMKQLMEKSQRTVNGLSGEGGDLTVARVQLLDVLSLANLAVGDGGKARELAEKENALAGGLLSKDPGNVGWRQHAAVARVRLAEALAAEGDFDGAIERARAGRAELVELTKDNPDNERLLWRLVLAYQLIGDALRAQGQLDSAEKEYRAWLDLLKGLESRQPKNPLWQRAIGFAYQRLGDNLLTQEKAAEAIQHFRIYQAQMASLAVAYPENAIFLEGLTFSHQRLGDALFAHNDNAGALEQYRSYREAATKLLKVDASNFRWQQLLQFTHQRIGDVLLRTDDHAGALAEFQVYLSMAEDSRKRDPQNNAVLYNVSNAHEKVGDALRVRGELPAARSEYQNELQFAEQLAAKRHSDATWQKALATSHQRIGLIFRMQNDAANAIDHFQKCASIPAKTTAWTPRSPWPRDVGEDCRRQIIELGGVPLQSPTTR
jgi:tetratricopeptide (TPR) repeat protein